MECKLYFLLDFVVCFHVLEIKNVGFNRLILTDCSEMLDTIENRRFKPKYHCGVIPYFEPEFKKPRNICSIARADRPKCVGNKCFDVTGKLS